MKVKRHIVLYILCFPFDVIGFLAVLLIRLFWGEKLRWETPPYSKEKGGGPCLTCQIKPESFPVTPGIFPKGWYWNKKTNRPWGGTTLGHGIFYGPYGRMSLHAWTRTQAHEHVHVEQFEASMLQGFLGGIITGAVVWSLGHPLPALISFLFIWFTGYLMMGVGGWLAAFFRGEPLYKGSQHEESAYAQDDGLVKR